jgi:hypothetical protein
MIEKPSINTPRLTCGGGKSPATKAYNPNPNPTPSLKIKYLKE